MKNNINLHILNAAGRLTPYIDKIENIFDKTVAKVLEKTFFLGTDVVISEFAEDTIPELGIGGHTYNPSLILISLDTKFPDFASVTLNKELKRIIVHELSHVARWQTVGYGETLLEASITEGLADHFDMEVNNTGPHLWDVVLNANKIKEMTERSKKEYNSKDYNHYEWFFGSKEKKIPRWTGYSLGFNLIAEYLKKNPSKKASQLHNIKAEEFIK